MRVAQFCPWNSPGQNTGVEYAIPFSMDLPSPGIESNPGIKPRSPSLQADCSHLSHQGSPFVSLLLLLSRFSRVQLCATTKTTAHQASPSLGFSRLDHWSRLPFPSPMHGTETWKWSCSVVSDSSRPHGLQSTRLLCRWNFPGKSTGVSCHCLLLESA